MLKYDNAQNSSCFSCWCQLEGKIRLKASALAFVGSSLLFHITKHSINLIAWSFISETFSAHWETSNSCRAVTLDHAPMRITVIWRAERKICPTRQKGINFFFSIVLGFHSSRVGRWQRSTLCRTWCDSAMAEKKLSTQLNFHSDSLVSSSWDEARDLWYFCWAKQTRNLWNLWRSLSVYKKLALGLFAKGLSKELQYSSWLTNKEVYEKLWARVFVIANVSADDVWISIEDRPSPASGLAKKHHYLSDLWT